MNASTEPSTSGSAHAFTLPIVSFADDLTTPPSFSLENRFKTLGRAVADGAFYQEVEGFTSAVMAEATANGWTADKDSIRRVLHSMEDLLRIQPVTSTPATSTTYTWQYRAHADATFTAMFPPRGAEEHFKQNIAAVATLFLVKAGELAREERNHRGSTSTFSPASPAFWEHASSRVRFLVCQHEERPPSTEVAQGEPDIVVVPEHVFDRKAKREALQRTLADLKRQDSTTGYEATTATRIECMQRRLTEPDLQHHVRHDEAIVIEAKLSTSKREFGHATNSSLFKTKHIKDVTLSNGDLWFVV